MDLNDFGQIVESEWFKTSEIRSNIELDEWVIMPNHFHGIIIINETSRGTARRAPTHEQFGNPTIGSIPTIVRAFKSAVSKRIHEMGFKFKWQRNYYEHIIRDDDELNRTRKYIMDNPKNWEIDEDYHA